jgi:hypothetical protein
VKRKEEKLKKVEMKKVRKKAKLPKSKGVLSYSTKGGDDNRNRWEQKNFPLSNYYHTPLGIHT